MAHNFTTSESGAVTVEYVVVTGGLVGLGLAVMQTVASGVGQLSGAIDHKMRDHVILTSFNTMSVEGFGADISGWDPGGTDSAQAIRYATGPGSDGRPGYLEWTDSSSDTASLDLPPNFTGNLSAAMGGSLSFDMALLEASSSRSLGPNLRDPTVKIRGTNGRIMSYLHPEVPTSSDWLTMEAPFEEGYWVNSSGRALTRSEMEAILRDVRDIEMRVEYVHGSETMGLDNIHLTAGS